MRTTLTLDDDVQLQLERACEREKITWKEAVNRHLRLGLARAERRPRGREAYRVQPVSTGLPRVDLRRAGELLAMDDEAAWARP